MGLDGWMRNGLTVLGNFSVDHVNDGAASPGGCPAFAARTLREVGGAGRVVGRLAREDAALFGPVFEEYGELIAPLWAVETSSFGLRYGVGEREMTVEAVPGPWTEADIDAAEIRTSWVHLGPLLRDDFPVDLMATLVERGHRLSFDGQGLVRVPELGPLRLDADYDPELLRSLAVLKLSDVEAEIVAAGAFDETTARRLGVPEILVTFGETGCDLYLDGTRVRVAANPIPEVQTTGAGDTFMVSYSSDRAAGADPLTAAQRASDLVSAMLEQRRDAEARRA
jgi:sugar/nucleoside kinase (ribokinase family)